MIYQYTKGHRFTTDDVCTAYFAVNEMRDFILGKSKMLSKVVENCEKNSDNGDIENLNDINNGASKLNDSVSTEVRNSDDGLGPYHLDLGNNFFHSLYFIVCIFFNVGRLLIFIHVYEHKCLYKCTFFIYCSRYWAWVSSSYDQMEIW
jgi:hypothetical protein